jgi:hypothetical protein
MSRFVWFRNHPDENWRDDVADTLIRMPIFRRTQPFLTQPGPETSWTLTFFDDARHERAGTHIGVPDLTANASIPNLVPQLHNQTLANSTPVSKPLISPTSNEIETLVAKLAVISYQDNIVYRRSFTDHWRLSAEEVLSMMRGFRPTDVGSLDIARRIIERLDEVSF